MNRVITGHRVYDLYARWNEDAFAIRTDLISILDGFNRLLCFQIVEKRSHSLEATMFLEFEGE